MARIYAGILGPLAMMTAMAHGMLRGADIESTLVAAGCALWGFAALGYGLGALGEWIVREAVEARIADEINAEKSLQNEALAGGSKRG